MSEKNKNPEVRFKGFTDDWEESEFTSVVTRVSSISEKVGLPRVEYEDIISGRGELNKNIYKKESSKIGIEFNNGDVLFGKLRPYLKNWLLSSFNGIAVGDFWVLRANESESKFIYYLIQTSAYETAANQSSGTKMPRSDWNLVSKTEFNIPTNRKEQSKLGKFFKHLDHLITLNQRKYDKLVTIKKAMLEKMFPKNGADVPEIRFKGFTEAWELRKLVDVSKITTGCSNREDSCLDGEFTFFDRSEDIRTSNIFLFDCEAIIVAGEGSDFEPKYFMGKFDLHQRTYAIMNFDSTDGKFLYYYIFLFRKYFFDQAVGSTVKSLRLPMFQKMPIELPSKPEQSKIGNYFKNLDTLITLKKRELEKMKNIKKACLEKMFV
jgi:type I restriction enzyme S subunit